jgi:hypothetical protein
MNGNTTDETNFGLGITEYFTNTDNAKRTPPTADGNLASDAKGKSTSGSNREAESTDALERGGLPHLVVAKWGNAHGAKGVGHRR